MKEFENAVHIDSLMARRSGTTQIKKNTKHTRTEPEAEARTNCWITKQLRTVLALAEYKKGYR